jgi:multidrug efflux pump subunit AcrA (membrane-fusion protein)
VVRRYLIPVLAIAALAAAGLYVSIHGDDGSDAPRANMFLKVTRRDFVRGVRLSGTVEAVESTTVSTPRLRGQGNNSLVIMRLVPSGTSVKPGDLLVEFDRQDQIRNALDRQADLNDLEQQIRKSQAEEASAKATDDSTLMQAESALQRARLELVKNDMLPKIEAEKNTLALEEAEAKLKQLKATYDLKRRAAAAAIHVLEINRDRAARSMQQAQANAERMLITSPIAGIAVIKTTWKNSGMLELQEGDEVRAGTPVVEVVDPSAMRAAGHGRPRRLSGSVVRRTRRADFADRRAVGAVAEGPHVRGAHRRHRIQSQADAGSHGVARRRAGARAEGARRAARRGGHRR